MIIFDFALLARQNGLFRFHPTGRRMTHPPNKAIEPTADSAIVFAQEVSGSLEPQFGGG
jgi:hypothetical protein